MSSYDEQWWDVQAALFVLNALPDDERAVLEKLLESDAHFSQAVGRWERHFDVLHRLTPAVDPPAYIWQAIQNRLMSTGEPPVELSATTSAAASPAQSVLSPSSHSSQSTRWWSRARVWQASTAFFAAAAMLLLALTVRLADQSLSPPAVIPPISTVAVVQPESGDALWAISVISDDTHDRAQVRVDQLSGEPLSDDQDYQLWMVASDESGVQSVGLIPSTPGSSVRLSLPIALQQASAFAVSLEQAGGTSADAPEGPVVASGAIVLSDALAL